jgi:hypothetical protein
MNISGGHAGNKLHSGNILVAGTKVFFCHKQKEVNKITQTFEWLYHDLIDETKIRAKFVHKKLRDPTIMLASAGPVTWPIVHAVPRLKGILDALIREIVGAGCA